MAAPKSKTKTLDSAVVFNSTARCLMRQIGVIFPHETNLEFIQRELTNYSSKTNAATRHVPAVKFFESMRIGTGIEKDGVELVLGDMILNQDERLFSDECTADIPALSAINLRAKWKVLSVENKKTIWEYLERMATLAAKVKSEHALRNGELSDLTDTIQSIADKLPPGMSDESKIRAVLSDPKLAAAAATINERLYSTK